MYNVVRLEKMAGTYVADCLYSGKYATVSGETYTPVAVENGMVGKLGGLIPGEQLYIFFLEHAFTSHSLEV